MPIRFHPDEHVPAGVTQGLRRGNIDVTTAFEAGLSGANDSAQLAFASQSGRVFVTQDDDFLRLHREGARHSGIAYCRQGTRKLGELLQMLILVHDLLTPEEMAGRVEFL